MLGLSSRGRRGKRISRVLQMSVASARGECLVVNHRGTGYSHVGTSRLMDRGGIIFKGKLQRSGHMEEEKLLQRVTVNPKIFGGKPIIRGRRLAVEHVLGMLAAGDTIETILDGYPWLEREDILACLIYARRLVGHERVELRSPHPIH